MGGRCHQEELTRFPGVLLLRAQSNEKRKNVREMRKRANAM